MVPQKINRQQVEILARKYALSYAQVRMIMEVEGSGKGFGDDGRLLIQFEPAWFKRLYTDWKLHAATSFWASNCVGNQRDEWRAFSNAYKEDPDAAMQATSVGNMQVMGFHYKKLGFKSVGAMWDFAKESEANQLELGLMFIKSKPLLYKAVKANDYHNIANYYNGFAYKEVAKHTGSIPYNLRLKNAFERFTPANLS